MKKVEPLEIRGTPVIRGIHLSPLQFLVFPLHCIFLSGIPQPPLALRSSSICACAPLYRLVWLLPWTRAAGQLCPDSHPGSKLTKSIAWMSCLIQADFSGLRSNKPYVRSHRAIVILHGCRLCFAESPFSGAASQPSCHADG